MIKDNVLQREPKKNQIVLPISSKFWSLKYYKTAMMGSLVVMLGFSIITKELPHNAIGHGLKGVFQKKHVNESTIFQ